MTENFLKTHFLIALIFVSVFAAATNPLSGKYILVIDIQEIWTKQMMNPAESKRLIENINSIIEKADADKVIYIESVVANLDLNLSGISVGFPDGLKLDDRLLLVNSNKIVKNKPNTFSTEQLRTFIINHRAEEFVVVGLAAEHCILATLLGGLELGYKMSVIPEAVAGKSEESKTKALNSAKVKGAEIISIHSI
jgi:nicotinamidase-related amidase